MSDNNNCPYMDDGVCWKSEEDSGGEKPMENARDVGLENKTLISPIDSKLPELYAENEKALFYRVEKETEAEKDYKYILKSDIGLAQIVKDTRKELIEEFLRDFRWYIVFQTHFHWIGSPACICKTNPIAFEKWMVKKWQGRLKK